MKLRLLSLVALATASVATAAPETVTASSFGFNKDDATQCLQAAINSGAKKVIVDNPGSPWIVEPISLASDQEVVLQDGVVVLAKADCFKGRSDCLFKFTRVKNSTLRGEGKAILRMRKADYQDTSRYEWAEWRHAISISGGENITVKDLTLESSGGDGIYVRGNGIPASKNVLLENLVCKDHHRQGISVISADKLLVRNCQFLATRGTPPQCGIDIEPNRPKDQIIDNVFENCIFNDNAASGIDLYLSPLDATTKPISITFRNCVSHNNGNTGIIITSSHSTPVKGTVLFEKCDVAGNRNHSLSISSQQPDGLDITFKDCTFNHGESDKTAMEFNVGRVLADFTGVHFQNCTLNPGKAVPMEFIGSSGCGLIGLDGDVTLPDNSKLDFAKLIAQNPPNPELRKFSTDTVDLKKVALYPNSVASPKSNTIPSRKGFTVVQYFPEPGDYTITFKPQQISKAPPVAYVIIRDSAGNSMGTFEFKGNEPYTYTYNAKHAGFIQYQVQKCQGMSVEASSPWGYDVSHRLALFRGRRHNFYFVAPKGLQEARIEVTGTGGETLDAAIVDETGKVLAEQKTIRGSHILIVKRPVADKDEVWTLRMTNVVEDHSFRLGTGILPIAATDPKNVFYKK